MRKKFLLTFALAVAAATAFAQSGPKYSAAPTDQDYRLTIVEPKANATITGKDIQIVLGGPRTPEGNRYPQNIEDKKQRDVNTPIFQIWIDDKDLGNVPSGQNVFVARDLSYGPHKIVVMAKNVAGELVDRKELSVTTVEASAASSVETRSSAIAGSTASKTESASTVPAPPSDQTASTGSAAGSRERASAGRTLPQTGSASPLLALVGVILIGSGVLLRRS